MPQTLDSTTGPTSSQQNAASRSLLRESKEAVSRSSHADVPGEEGLHYGRKFAETVERFQARQAERESHEGDADAAKPAGEATKDDGVRIPSLIEEIGRNTWSRVADFTKATGAFMHSSWKLAMLPKETLTLAARRLIRAR